MGSQSEANININHKDTLFQLIFGKEEHKSYLLELYNALTNSSYSNLNDLTINTLEKAVYMNMKNDVSCIIDSRMTLFEHQSTFNPNMPLRGFFYFASLLHSYVDNLNDADIYGSKLIKIPTPQYIVLYNGIDKEIDDRITLKLSDSFKQKDESGNFEWTATMININMGHSKDLLEKCKPLRDYSIFVYKVRKYTSDLGGFEPGFEKAVEECIKEGCLANILRKSRAEVHKVCLYEFDQEKHDRIVKAQSYNDGMQAGMQAGMQEGMQAGMQTGMQNLVCSLYELGLNKEVIIVQLMKQYSLEQDEAETALNKYLPTIN